MSKRTGIIMLILIVLVVTGVGRALAQDVGGNAPQAALGMGFTYQGQLKDGAGTPITKTCDFVFTLWDALNAGAQIGVTSVVPGISVTSGAFTAVVNGANQFGSNAFTGQARWLQIQVKCVGDLAYTTLTPRQAVTPAPYALSLRSGAAIQGDGGGSGIGLYVQNTTTSGTTYGLVGESASTAGRGVYGNASALTGGSTGVYGSSRSTAGYGVAGSASAASGSTSGVYGTSASTSGRGVTGYASALTGSTSGVKGVVDSTNGNGVYGLVGAASGITVGVRGESQSTGGTGVYGKALATAGAAFGVKGETASRDGMGVAGWASDTTGSGFAYGVYGRTDSLYWVAGVYGAASASTSVTYGVEGMSLSNSGIGVYGNVPATSGTTYGIYGLSKSTSGSGVYGLNDSSSGTTYGVLGLSYSANGNGVMGYATNTTGSSNGVMGQSDSSGGSGVFGHATAASGTTYGVYGESDSTTGGAGVFGYSPTRTGVFGQTSLPSFSVYGVAGFSWNGGGVGVGAWAYEGDLFEGFSGDYPGGTLRFYVNNVGDIYAHGTVHTFAPSSLDGAEHATSSIQSSETWMEDFGFASLQNGKAVVKIAADFAGMVDLSVDYHIFLTPLGKCALYVAERTPSSFTIATLDGQTCSTDFDYRIVARPAGTKSVRLPALANPAGSPASRPASDSNLPGVLTQPAINPGNIAQPGEKPQP